jgi:hypothetical protein
MHKYFNYSKIFEAEQMGTPLEPTDMGINQVEAGANPVSLISESDLAKYTLDLQLSESDIDALYDSAIGYIEKNEQALIDKDGDLSKNKVINVKIINSDNADSSIATDDATKLIMTTTSTILGNIGVTSDAFTGIIETKFPSNRGEVTVRLSPAINTTVASTNKVEIAKPNQEVLPEPAVIGANPWESKLMSFDSFVNEGKKKWIDSIDMKTNALKKEMKDDKLSISDLNKKEADLKKKDKDKKKPGLQLDAKDAKTRKRVTLAKNLMKASGADKK